MRIWPRRRLSSIFPTRPSRYRHRLIRIAGPNGAGPFKPRHALARHQGDVALIEQELAKPFDGPTVVVTHHTPHARSIRPKYADTVLSEAFAPDLTAVIERGQPDLWLHGHTHASSDYRVGETRVVCNPKGYGPSRPGRRPENVAFDVGMVVEV